ncbi:MAG: hypothetical protein CMJ84_17255 [Planctomycetes bacterium]|nr:hypothetical protein [Planctomycetota bacterium]
MVGSLLVVTSLLIGQAEIPSDGDLASQVQMLVRQLRDGKLEQRDAAEKALIALGPGVLDHLPALQANTTVGVQVRLGRVLKTLASRIVDKSMPVSRVSLAGEMSLAEALSALEKQTGNRVVGLYGRGGQVKPKFDKTSYWEALDELLDQAGMRIDEYGGSENALTVVARPEGQELRRGRADYFGQFRVETTRIQAVRGLRRPDERRLMAWIEVAWEPRLTPVYLVQPLSDVTATDENGDAITIEGLEGARGVRANHNISSVEIGLPLQLPDRNVKQIALLKGNMTATLLGRVESFEFANLSDAEDELQRRSGVTVVLERIRKTDGLYDVYVRMRFDQAADTLQSYRIWVSNAQAFMIDAEGRRMEHLGYETTREDAKEIGMAYTFDLKDGPQTCKFVIRIPTLIVDTPVNYELKNIALP